VLSISEINFTCMAFMTSLVLKVFSVHRIVSPYVFSYLNSLFVHDTTLWNVVSYFFIHNKVVTAVLCEVLLTVWRSDLSN
jgi:hypothetical protein